MFQTVVQATKDVYGVNLSDVPSEDDLTIYARWESFTDGHKKSKWGWLNATCQSAAFDETYWNDKFWRYLGA